MICKCGHSEVKHVAADKVPGCPLHHYLLADEHCECGWRACQVKNCECRRLLPAIETGPKRRASRAKGLLVVRFDLAPWAIPNHVPMGAFGDITVSNLTGDYYLEVSVRAFRVRKRRHRAAPRHRVGPAVQTVSAWDSTAMNASRPSNLVVRLRAGDEGNYDELLPEAADEIERLTKERDGWIDEAGKAVDHADRLRAALDGFADLRTLADEADPAKFVKAFVHYFDNGRPADETEPGTTPDAAP